MKNCLELAGGSSYRGFELPGARSIQPRFRPVRPGKEDHLKRWTIFFETFPVGPNRSIEFWTEISGNFGWMDRAPGVDCTSQVNHNPLLAYSLCKTCMDLVCRPSTCNIGHFFEIWELSSGSRPSDSGGPGQSGPEIIGGGERSPKNLFPVLRASFWSKNRRGGPTK